MRCYEHFVCQQKRRRTSVERCSGPFDGVFFFGLEILFCLEQVGGIRRNGCSFRLSGSISYR